MHYTQSYRSNFANSTSLYLARSSLKLKCKIVFEFTALSSSLKKIGQYQYSHVLIHVYVRNRDITDKSPENFSGHLVAPDNEFGGIFARSVHLKLSEKVSRHLVASFSREASSNT